jgi:hypothetical protein
VLQYGSELPSKGARGKKEGVFFQLTKFLNQITFMELGINTMQFEFALLLNFITFTIINTNIVAKQISAV